ncbi:hypothetical protein [Phenylobacterium sp.]|uniref:hypothetical protein n=1 Tax=Phenylobacterium sp. TaxID=1871053 RepID=UPI0027180143|nr:hypothetical protein [Phenylobacterium sp.]MDO8800096.1 hypothetical protein [Phenylobacterium sp.]
MMARACENCEWARDEADDADWLSCREGPDPIPVRHGHWCGRFRVAERLMGGRDVRQVAA